MRNSKKKIILFTTRKAAGQAFDDRPITTFFKGRMLSQNDARPCSSSSNLMKMHFFIQVANDISKSINTGGTIYISTFHTMYIICMILVSIKHAERS